MSNDAKILKELFKNIKFTDKGIKKWWIKYYYKYIKFLDEMELKNLFSFNLLIDCIIDENIEDKEVLLEKLFLPLSNLVLGFIDGLKENSIKEIEFIDSIKTSVNYLEKIYKDFYKKQILDFQIKILEIRSKKYWDPSSGKRFNIFDGIPEKELINKRRIYESAFLSKDFLVLNSVKDFDKKENIFIQAKKNILSAMFYNANEIGEKELEHKDNKVLFNSYFKIFGTENSQKEYLFYLIEKDTINKEWAEKQLLNIKQKKQLPFKEFDSFLINTLYQKISNEILFYTKYFLTQQNILISFNYLGLLNINKDITKEKIEEMSFRKTKKLFDAALKKDKKFIREIIDKIEELIREIIQNSKLSYLKKNNEELGLLKQISIMIDNNLIGPRLAYWLIYSLVDKERGLNLRNIFNGHTGNIKFTNLNFQDLFMIIIIAVDLKTVLYLIKKENNKAITKNKK